MASIHLRIGNLLTGLAIALLLASGAMSACGVGNFPGLPRSMASGWQARASATMPGARPGSPSDRPASPKPDALPSKRSARAALTVPPAAPPPSWPIELPSPAGPCPELVAGSLTFAPPGLKARSVRIWISPEAAAVRDGPLVFYWHAAGSQPSEAVDGLSEQVVRAITDAGGLVAALYPDTEAGALPWFLSSEGPAGRDDDLRIADEVVGCAARKPGLDLRRIHTVGLGAGAVQAAQMSYRRSSYVASAVSFSGGFDEQLGLPALQVPANRFAALIFHPEPGDHASSTVRRASETYWSDLTAHRRFAVLCRHSGREAIPMDARASAWDFLQNHPYGQEPSPWERGLPPTFPRACTLTPEVEPAKSAPLSVGGDQKRWDPGLLDRLRG